MIESPDFDPAQPLDPAREDKQRDLSSVESADTASTRGWLIAGAVCSLVAMLFQRQPDRMLRFLAGEAAGILLTIPCAVVAAIIASSLLGISLGSLKTGTLRLVALWMIAHSLGLSLLLVLLRLENPSVALYAGLLIGHLALSIALVQESFDWHLTETMLFVGLMDALLLGGILGAKAAFPEGWIWLTS